MWGDAEACCLKTDRMNWHVWPGRQGLIEAAGGRARTPKGQQTNEESGLSCMTLRRTENRLLVNLLSAKE